MTFPSSVLTSTGEECINKVALTSSFEDSIQSQSKKPTPTMSKSRHQPVALIAILGGMCMVCIIGLLASAFIEEAPLECTSDCADNVTSETATMLLAFIMGWAFCLFAKGHRQPNLAGQLEKIACSAKGLSASFSSLASSIASALTCRYRSGRGWVANQGPRIGRILGITLVIAMCVGCIVGLFISAFTVVPGEEPAEDGLASESSQTMKAFTIGWMFLLSFKLRHELVGLVGSSCLLQPC